MNTDYKNIDNILNKYFEGMTSLQEEKLLRNYFASGQVAPAHEAYRALFQYTAEAHQQTTPVPFKIQVQPKSYRFYYAASVALLIGLSLVWFLQSDKKTNLNMTDAATHIQVSNNNKQKKKEAEKELKKFTKNVQKGLDNAGALSIFGSTTKKVFKIKNQTK